MVMVSGGQFFGQNFLRVAVHYTLDVYVYNQKCRIWGSEKTQEIEERPLHPKKLNYLVRSLVQRCDWLRYHPICVKKCSKITLKGPMLATLRGKVI